MIQANTNKHKEEAATIRPNQSSRGDQIMKSEDHLAAETVRQKREPRRWTSSWPCWQRLWWPRRRCWMRCLPSWTPASCRAWWHRCRRPAKRSRAQGWTCKQLPLDTSANHLHGHHHFPDLLEPGMSLRGACRSRAWACRAPRHHARAWWAPGPTPAWRGCPPQGASQGRGRARGEHDTPAKAQR